MYCIPASCQSATTCEPSDSVCETTDTNCQPTDTSCQPTNGETKAKAGETREAKTVETCETAQGWRKATRKAARKDQQGATWKSTLPHPKIGLWTGETAADPEEWN